MRNNGQAVEVPACQSERNEAFTRAVRAGDAKTAAALVRAEPPEDATEAERERWRKRRRLASETWPESLPSGVLPDASDPLPCPARHCALRCPGARAHPRIDSGPSIRSRVLNYLSTFLRRRLLGVLMWREEAVGEAG